MNPLHMHMDMGLTERKRANSDLAQSSSKEGISTGGTPELSFWKTIKANHSPIILAYPYQTGIPIHGSYRYKNYVSDFIFPPRHLLAW